MTYRNIDGTIFYLLRKKEKEAFWEKVNTSRSFYTPPIENYAEFKFIGFPFRRNVRFPIFLDFGEVIMISGIVLVEDIKFAFSF